MNMFVAKFRDVVKGILTGFDRIVFKGMILPLMDAKGAMSFCRAHSIRMTPKGRELTTALDALLAASTKQLMSIAA
jgi:hypothetical protein